MNASLQQVRSWGGTINATHRVLRLKSRDAGVAVMHSAQVPALAFGRGRSYGDVPLNPGGTLIDCCGLDRFISFDRATGSLHCEAGVRLADILAVVCKPEPGGGGWFLPVSPGTRFVTLAGAIANDVHGKNHHGFGTIGRHIESLELARSDGSRIVCSPTAEPDLFAATIGGLGLTGLILSATLRLRRVDGLALEAEDIRFDSLDDYFGLAAESEPSWEYTAAWVDCAARGAALGRGIYSRARHAPGVGAAAPPREPRRNVPFVPPVGFVNRLSVRAFNALYWRKLGSSGRVQRTGSYEPVFYPLDAIGSWNRLYGPMGFFQFQCVVPPTDARSVVSALLDTVGRSGEGSMLAVLKGFGDLPSPGLLSFPRPGITLALDFPNRGQTTLALLRRLEDIVMEAGGRLYPAKDAVMTAESFWRGYPQAERFQAFMDPALSSAFARRVGLAAQERLS